MTAEVKLVLSIAMKISLIQDELFLISRPGLCPSPQGYTMFLYQGSNDDHLFCHVRPAMGPCVPPAAGNPGRAGDGGTLVRRHRPIYIGNLLYFKWQLRHQVAFKGITTEIGYMRFGEFQ